MSTRSTAERLEDATPLSPDELRRFAENILAEHDPEVQGHGYGRCERCNFTHHPCDTFDLAAAVVRSLSES